MLRLPCAHPPFSAYREPGLQGAERVWNPGGRDPEWILLSTEVNAIRVNLTLIYLKAFQKAFH